MNETNITFLMSIGLVIVISTFIIFIVGKKNEFIQKEKRSGWSPSLIVIEKFRKAYPGITIQEYELTLLALKDFFEVIFKYRASSKNFLVSMPSVVVDALWHELILDTKNYMKICELYGGYIHHTPEAVEFEVDFSQKPVGEGLLRTYMDVKTVSQIDDYPLPLLFAIDDLLGLHAGYKYNPSILDNQVKEFKKKPV